MSDDGNTDTVWHNRQTGEPAAGYMRRIFIISALSETISSL